MRPTTVLFGAVLQGFARAGDTKRAKAIVEHMEKLMNTDGYGEMRPNTVIYNILINAYARSRTPGAIDNRVLLILDKMKKYGEEGHSDTNPTIITYNASYQHSPQVEAMSFKNWKKQNEVKSQFLPTILPDVTYTTILKILTTSRVPKKTMSIISVMEKDLDNPKLRPNKFTYDAVIKLCGRPSSNDAKLRRHALILAVKTLTKIQDLPHIQETPYSYGAFFSTLAKLTSGQEYAMLLEKSFRDCCIAGVLDERILENLIRAAPRNILQPLLSTSVSLREITLKDLPQSWSRTSRGSITTRSQRSTERSTHNTGRTKIKR